MVEQTVSITSVDAKDLDALTILISDVCRRFHVNARLEDDQDEDDNAVVTFFDEEDEESVRLAAESV